MPGSFKAEVLSNILNEAQEARKHNIPGHKNTYEPEEYLKVRAETLAMNQMEQGDYLKPMHNIGEIEFDANGNLKQIARNRPAMLDLAYYTRNRYEVEKIIPANEKKAKLPRGTYILVVIGNPIVKAITDTVELPKNVKAYRFKREEILVDAEEVMTENEKGETMPITEAPQTDEKGEPVKVEPGEKVTTYYWKYIGAEMIQSDRVYKMTRQLKPHDMLELLSQIEEGVNYSDNVDGDSLDDIE